MAKILDGKAIASRLLIEMKSEIEQLRKDSRLVPSLAVILVGDNPASEVYVSSKAKTCRDIGISSTTMHFSSQISEDALLEEVAALNANPACHGILVQLPLPAHIRAERVITALSPLKDVDGLHPENVGLLCSGAPRFVPCTPLGVCEILLRSGIEVKGREVVVLGRSNLVGRPLSILLSSKGGQRGDATVTLCHSRSAEIPKICRRADILIAAIGREGFVKRQMVKPGAVVIDVGIHRREEGGRIRLRGDVDFDDVFPIVSCITPVPGGVGPMTIAMLMRNTVNAARASLQKKRY